MTDKKHMAAIYCRLSKEDKEKENECSDSESIQNQKLLLIDYADKKGWSIYGIYSDDDKRGFDNSRAEYNRLLKDAEAGKFDIVLCKHQSRFTRDKDEAGKYLDNIFLLWGIRFISVIDHVDTADIGNKKARQINGLVNEWHSEDLSNNIREIFRSKMTQGQYLGSFASYGYMKDPNDKHKLIIDPIAADVVKRIFSMYLDGAGTEKIAKALTGKVPTPTQYKQEQGLKFQNPNSAGYSKQYGIWAGNSVKRILTNPVYIGTLIQGRERKVSFKSKKVVTAPEDEWVVIPNNHKAIITEERFNTVQRLITSRRADRNINKGLPQSQPHMLSGKLKCLDCGATMKRSGVSRDKTQHFLVCTLSAKSSRSECSPHCIIQEKVEDYILENIRELIGYSLNENTENEIIAKVFRQLNGANDLKAVKQKQLKEAEAELNKLQRNLTALYTDKLSGNISEEEYKGHKGVFDEDRQKLLSKKEALEIELEGYDKKLKSHEHIKALLEKYKSIDKLTHAVINDFVESVLIGEKDNDKNEQKIVINWQF